MGPKVKGRKLPTFIELCGQLIDTAADDGFFISCDILESEIGLLTELTNLEILEGGISSIPTQIGLLTKLTNLNIVNNEVAIFPKEIAGLTSLVYLDLTNNNLLELPTQIGLLQFLAIMKLENNELQSLPSEIGVLSNLYELTLQNNSLTSLPEELGNLSALDELLLDYNELPSLISEVGKLTSLHNLALAGNHLTHIPKELGLLPLEFLDLEYNEISHLPSTIGQLNSLQSLIVDGNQLTTLPSEIAYCTALSNIELENNLFETLPTQLGELFDLVAINARNNKIGFLPTELGRLMLLTSLDVSNNEISEISVDLSNWDFLDKLNISDNQIHTIPTEIAYLTSMEDFIATGNKYDTLPSEMVALTNLGLLRLDPVVCDCRVTPWFDTLLDNSFIFNSFETTSCKDVNEYFGGYPHLLRSDDDAPCTHATIETTSLNVSNVDARISWKYEKVVDSEGELLLGRTPLFGSNSTTLQQFRECGALENIVDTGVYFGFEVNLELVDQSYELRECYSAGELQLENNTDYGLYTIHFEELTPASVYEFSIRPFAFDFLNGQRISYRSGILSKVLPITTLDSVPETSPKGVVLLGAGSREITLAWDEFTEQVGEIVEYEAQLITPTGQIYSNLDSITTVTFRSSESEPIEPEANYSFRVRARTRVPQFGPWSEEQYFATCPVNMRKDTSNDGECFALIGYFQTSGIALSCSALPSSSIESNGCLVEGLDVTSLPLAQGFWRPSLDSLDITKCPDKGFCMPNEKMLSYNDTRQYCSEFHKGIYCFDCEEGYYLSDNGCIACDSNDLSKTKTALGIYFTLVILIVLALFTRMVANVGIFHELVLEQPDGVEEDEDSKKQRTSLRSKILYAIKRISVNALCCLLECAKFIKRGISNQGYSEFPEPLSWSTKLQILYGFYQVLFCYAEIFNVDSLTDGFTGFIGFIAKVDFTYFFEVFNLRCLFDFDHYDDLVFRTAWPLIVVIILYTMKGVIQLCYRKGSAKVHSNFISTVLLIMFVVYPSVCQKIFESFWCQDFTDADTKEIPNSALKSDYRISCDDFSFMTYYVAFMILVYPLGVVLLYLYYLRPCGFLVYKPKRTESDEIKLRKVSFLLAPYVKDVYWFEAYELVRKLAQTSLIGFFVDDLQLLTLITLNVSIASIIILVFYAPYKKRSDGYFALFSLFLLGIASQYSVVQNTGSGGTISDAFIALVYFELVAFLGFLAFDWYIFSLNNSYLNQNQSIKKMESYKGSEVTSGFSKSRDQGSSNKSEPEGTKEEESIMIGLL